MSVGDLGWVTPRLQNVKGPDQKGWHKAHCPFPDHPDKKPSFAFNESGYSCFGCGRKGSLRALRAQLGGSPSADGGHPEAEFVYRDEKGRPLFQVRRYPGKQFRQFRADGIGGWSPGTRGVRPVPYRLPELKLAVKNSSHVFIVEGEKDVEALRAAGLAATTAPMGAGKWRREFSRHLRGARVAVLPDNDPPGLKHARAVAKSVSGLALETKVVCLPDLPPKGDVSDWLAAGGTPEALLALVDSAELWAPDSSYGSNRRRGGTI